MRRAACLAVLLVAADASSPSAAPSSKEADAVKAQELKRFDAATHNDLEALEKLLADDLTYTHSSAVMETKAQFLESLRSGKVRYQSIESSDLQVRVYGAVAIINGKAKVALVADGQPKKFELRYTDVWHKRGGRWQMVAWQSTRLPDAAPAPAPPAAK